MPIFILGNIPCAEVHFTWYWESSLNFLMINKHISFILLTSTYIFLKDKYTDTYNTHLKWDPSGSCFSIQSDYVHLWCDSVNLHFFSHLFLLVGGFYNYLWLDLKSIFFFYFISLCSSFGPLPLPYFPLITYYFLVFH